MKKIFIFLTPVLIIFIYFGCSKDHSAPTNSLYGTASSPDSVNAEYDTVNDEVKVSWTMSDTSGVKDFFVAVSDSSVFDKGETRGFYTNFDNPQPPYSFIYKAHIYNKLSDTGNNSLVLYFNVSAVYKNEVFNNYVGPRAVMPGKTYGDSAYVARVNEE
ncbi:MAG: hypothetical protein HOC71_07535 [Candidatus Latescibacteria bacterium]|nr:hypothetical protein [Candidatus Latescibacterota bacterium]